ncbi:LLM class flavin-dependent oxidoreductase [Salipaludibacillus keqinensis]|uniref:LLM class flavin-dependent oxidoreductase n=1 Tax=Salipaludibacillus keqinensis TaxID=2045207 RepID=A0A323TRG2_9BACI|nr:LLM class flavin-dependent oxidoreductase [Salipaludibacillus keqinensis]PYZ91945.1 LLM class flavin-dependent oxidoreductase [Salipaludibacillus keqinensis]
MKLSILDPSPVSSNQTAQQALQNSRALAQMGEKWGYTRYWMTEHHDLPGLACSAPEVVLSYIGAHTESIRLGTGAMLLPHYKPFKVAEIHHTLATLFPGRIDVGMGRAPGGSAEVTNALSDQFLQQVFKMPELVEELLQFLEQDTENNRLSASPLPDIKPEPWLLGTSKKSSRLAAEKGIAYAFAHFMSDNDGRELIQQYLKNFQPRKEGDRPKVLVAVSVICADTNEKANEVALSSLIWSLQKEKGEGKEEMPSIADAKQYELSDVERQKLAKMKQKMVIGNRKEVNRELIEISSKYQTDEIMVISTTYSLEDILKSYWLISEEVNHS